MHIHFLQQKSNSPNGSNSTDHKTLKITHKTHKDRLPNVEERHMSLFFENDVRLLNTHKLHNM